MNKYYRKQGVSCYMNDNVLQNFTYLFTSVLEKKKGNNSTWKVCLGTYRNWKEMTSIVCQYNNIQKQSNNLFSNAKLITVDILKLCLLKLSYSIKSIKKYQQVHFLNFLIVTKKRLAWHNFHFVPYNVPLMTKDKMVFRFTFNVD